MKLRTVRGNPYPRRCACGCQAEVPVGDDVKVVVDLDTSRPRKNYLPDHSPDSGSWKARGVSGAPKAEEKSVLSQPSGLALVAGGSVRDVAQVCSCGCGFQIPSLATSRSFACSVPAQIRPTRSTERNPQRRVETESS